MSSDYPIPPGYLSMGDALARARRKYVTDFRPKLKGLLLSGELCGWCSDRTGQIKPIEPAFWTEYFAKKAFEKDEIQMTFRPGAYFSEGRPVFLESDLDQFHPTMKQRTTDQARLSAIKTVATQRPAPPPKKGGRPRNPDVDSFFIEATRLIVAGEQGSPEHKQEPFFDAMETWAKQNMTEPYSRDTIEKKIKKLWQACWPNPRG